MQINDTLDKLVQKNQSQCDCSYQDRVTINGKVSCGKCGKEAVS